MCWGYGTTGESEMVKTLTHFSLVQEITSYAWLMKQPWPRGVEPNKMLVIWGFPRCLQGSQSNPLRIRGYTCIPTSTQHRLQRTYCMKYKGDKRTCYRSNSIVAYLREATKYCSICQRCNHTVAYVWEVTVLYHSLEK